MDFISDEYLTEQKLLHEESAYGSRGYYWAYLAGGIASIEHCASILDYGCGKGTLGQTLKRGGYDARLYDPAVPEFSGFPKKADLVVSVDVMEHIEPDKLDAVLDHIGALALKLLFVAISTIPAKRFLSDGRNTHLIIEAGGWWRPKFEARGFSVRRVWNTGMEEWVALMQAKPR